MLVKAAAEQILGLKLEAAAEGETAGAGSPEPGIDFAAILANLAPALPAEAEPGAEPLSRAEVSEAPALVFPEAALPSAKAEAPAAWPWPLPEEGAPELGAFAQPDARRGAEPGLPTLGARPASPKEPPVFPGDPAHTPDASPGPGGIPDSPVGKAEAAASGRDAAPKAEARPGIITEGRSERFGIGAELSPPRAEAAALLERGAFSVPHAAPSEQGLPDAAVPPAEGPAKGAYPQIEAPLAERPNAPLGPALAATAEPARDGAKLSPQPRDPSEAGREIEATVSLAPVPNREGLPPLSAPEIKPSAEGRIAQPPADVPPPPMRFAPLSLAGEAGAAADPRPAPGEPLRPERPAPPPMAPAKGREGATPPGPALIPLLLSSATDLGLSVKISDEAPSGTAAPLSNGTAAAPIIPQPSPGPVGAASTPPLPRNAPASTELPAPYPAAVLSADMPAAETNAPTTSPPAEEQAAPPEVEAASPPPLPREAAPVPGLAGATVFADTLSSADAAPAGRGGEAGPRPHPAPELGPHAARQVAIALSAGGERIELRLDPEELGPVRLSLAPAEGAVTVHLTAERSDALDLLRRHADILMRDLREAGYGEVNLRFGSEGSGQGQRGAFAPPVPVWGAAAEPPSAAVAEIFVPPPPRAPSGAGLDLRL